METDDHKGEKEGSCMDSRNYVDSRNCVDGKNYADSRNCVDGKNYADSRNCVDNKRGMNSKNGPDNRRSTDSKRKKAAGVQEIDLIILEYMFRHHGSFPTIEEILSHFRGMPHYKEHENRLIGFICRNYVLTDQLPVRVKFTDSHISRIQRALASMAAGSARQAG